MEVNYDKFSLNTNKDLLKSLIFFTLHQIREATNMDAHPLLIIQNDENTNTTVHKSTYPQYYRSVFFLKDLLYNYINNLGKDKTKEFDKKIKDLVEKINKKKEIIKKEEQLYQNLYNQQVIIGIRYRDIVEKNDLDYLKYSTAEEILPDLIQICIILQIFPKHFDDTLNLNSENVFK